jgi:hypothetical protein
MFDSKRLALIFLVVQTSHWPASGALQCMDDSGKPVDWLVLYKLPQASSKNKGKNKGTSGLVMSLPERSPATPVNVEQFNISSPKRHKCTLTGFDIGSNSLRRLFHPLNNLDVRISFYKVKFDSFQIKSDIQQKKFLTS